MSNKNNNEKTKERDSRLDIIRIFALFTVIGVHFFLNSGFYSEIVAGPKMYVMCILRSFFIICVPMFIVLSGYLLNQKKLSKKYYKGIIKTLGVYVLCSIAYSLFYKYYLHGEMNIGIFFKNLFAYAGTSNSWYIEMYVGLFMLIPFLNLIFNNLKTKKEAQALILTLLFLIGLPTILNVFNFESLEWWKTPYIAWNYNKILPSWWTGIYPIFYYFLGAYLSKYPLKMKTITNIILLIVVVILDGMFNIYRSHNLPFVWAQWNDYSSAAIMLTTMLTFNLLLRINIKPSEKGKKFLKLLSDSCIGGYLISCIFEIAFYQKLSEMILVAKDRFIYAPLVILIILVCSLVSAILINIIYEFLKKIIVKAISLIKKKADLIR